jgi:hypothetical protein
MKNLLRVAKESADADTRLGTERSHNRLVPVCDWTSHQPLACPFINRLAAGDPNALKKLGAGGDSNSEEVLAMAEEVEVMHAARQTSDGKDGGAVSVVYCGLWQPVVLSELVVQDESGISCREEMVGDIKNEMSNAKGLSELDKLDMEMMLCCLEPSTDGGSGTDVYGGGGGGGEAAGEMEERRVLVASCALVLDGGGRLVNGPGADQQTSSQASAQDSAWCCWSAVDVAMGSLSELGCNKDSYWLEYAPPHPGALVLPRRDHRSSATAAAAAGGAAGAGVAVAGTATDAWPAGIDQGAAMARAKADIISSATATVRAIKGRKRSSRSGSGGVGGRGDGSSRSRRRSRDGDDGDDGDNGDNGSGGGGGGGGGGEGSWSSPWGMISMMQGRDMLPQDYHQHKQLNVRVRHANDLVRDANAHTLTLDLSMHNAYHTVASVRAQSTPSTASPSVAAAASLITIDGTLKIREVDSTGRAQATLQLSITDSQGTMHTPPAHSFNLALYVSPRDELVHVATGSEVARPSLLCSTPSLLFFV